MIRVFPNGWKKTVGIVITMNNGSLFENGETEGFTHFAEHLMFSGTEKDTRYQLREKHDRFFHSLEARTSREEVSIFCLVDMSDVHEAIKTLYEMIFRWKCRSNIFEDEKQDLLQETRAYMRSTEHRQRKSVDTFLSIPQREILGNLPRLKKLQFSDVQKIKRYWNHLLQETPIDILLVGESVTKKHVVFCHNLFKTTKKHTKCTEWNMIKTEFVTKKNAHALVVSCTKKHPYLLFFGQLLDQRSQSLPSNADYTFAQFKHQTIFFVSGVQQASAKKFFLHPISVLEFNQTKQDFLQRFRRALDGIDATDSLLWLQGFRFETYADLPSENPLEIYKMFERMRYQDFARFVTSVKKN
ncbi:MAG: insulinase family protein [Candidatus Uhrbacteria bacterium]|nr:insulinase family protein [Candidatus Uhrbacteria bacterium]